MNSAGLIVGEHFLRVYGGAMGSSNPVDPGRSGIAILQSDRAGFGFQWFFYPMSSDHGPLRVVAVAGSVVSLTDKAGEVVSLTDKAGEVVKFDAATNAFVN